MVGSLVPSGEGINFEYANGRAEFTVSKVDIHQMVEIKIQKTPPDRNREE